MNPSFEWDETKNQENLLKHNISFEEARKAFEDPNHIISKDIEHSTVQEIRYYCIGKVGKKVCTVRFTYRNKRISIFGAGYWRKERKLYEKTT